jgi:ABC-type transport system involved in cytochrome bd biosynthesis fused ATPase/permease subunit
MLAAFPKQGDIRETINILQVQFFSAVLLEFLAVVYDAGSAL